MGKKKKQKQQPRQWYKLIIALILTHGTGVIGASATTPAIPDWYAHLAKPFFTPPNWIFAPVWLVLYTILAIAMYLVWREVSLMRSARKVIWGYLVHIVFLASWSIVFFGTHEIGLAFGVIMGALVSGLCLTVHSWDIDRRATYLLLPHVAWILFAAALNGYIVFLN